MSEQRPLHLRIQCVQWEAEGVVSLHFVDPDGSDLPAWEPGAHLDLVLPSGLVRQYSLCGRASDKKSYRVAILLEEKGRGGSQEVHGTGLVGRVLEAHGPKNHFELADAESYLFLAGGIGITPILPMIERAAALGIPWKLSYGAKSLAHMSFLGQLGEMKGGELDLVPQDVRGLMDIRSILADADPNALVYGCGPEPMLHVLEEITDSFGMRSRLRLERFGAITKRVDPETGNRDTGFEVELKSSGIVLYVPPDRSVLSVVRDVLPDVLSSCEEGYCGTCETLVLSGTPDHRDSILSDAERSGGEIMMICVSRSRSDRLVLDL